MSIFGILIEYFKTIIDARAVEDYILIRMRIMKLSQLSKRFFACLFWIGMWICDIFSIGIENDAFLFGWALLIRHSL